MLPDEIVRKSENEITRKVAIETGATKEIGRVAVFLSSDVATSFMGRQSIVTAAG